MAESIEAISDVINEPAVVAEITACFDSSDAALLSNDVSVLDGWFWPTAHAVRYGLGEESYGFTAIAAQRRTLAAGVVRSPLTRRTVTAFGQDVATVCAEFDDVGTVGRQSQTGSHHRRLAHRVRPRLSPSPSALMAGW